MKKFLLVLLILVLAIGCLTACDLFGNKDDSDLENPGNPAGPNEPVEPEVPNEPNDPEVPVEPEEPEEPEVKIDDLVLTVANLGLKEQTYADGSATVDGVTFGFIELGNYGNGIQTRNKTKASSLGNVTAFKGGIKSIIIKLNENADGKHDSDGVFSFTFGNSKNPLGNAVKFNTTKGVYEYTITPNVDTYTYFSMVKTNTYSSYFDSITFVFGKAVAPVDPEAPEEPTTPEEPMTPEVPSTLTTIAEALKGKEGDKATFSGTVSGIYYEWSEQYENMSFYVTEGEDTILVFRAGTKVEIGDYVSVNGTIAIYKGTAQIGEGSMVSVVSKPTTPEEPEEPTTPEVTDTHTTISDALGGSEGDKAIFSGTVSGIYYEWSEQYRNMSFYVTEGEDTILVFRAGTKVEIGDYVSVNGTIAIYKGTAQIGEGSTVSVVSKPTTPEEPEEPTIPENPNYTYTDFTDEEKASYREIIGFVIPFVPNDDYMIEVYEENGYKGVYLSAIVNSEADFNAYRALYSSYTDDGTDIDEDGDTWYLYSKGDVYVDMVGYLYEGEYYVDVDAYVEVGGSEQEPEQPEEPTTPENPGNDDNQGSTTIPDGVITNEGAGLPTGENGVYNVDFTTATNVKKVTDQGYYLEGCPTTGAPGVLVIPVEFSNVTASSKGYTIDAIKNAFEKDGKNDYYSVYDYYYISSYGDLTLDITVLDSWFKPTYTSDYYERQTMDYYGEETAIGDQMVMDEALAYLAGIMDLSKFDSDNNGTIDAVVLITTLEINSEETFYWAYRYWNLYSDEEDNYYEYDGVSANDYLWAPYQFLFETRDAIGDTSFDDESALNTYTFIHEFGHVLGADDYYDTAYVGSPMGGYDIMDGEIGDHNAYSKFNYGWITSSRLVVGDESVTLTLTDFSQNGDTIIIANNWKEELGAYQEYYVLAYYTNNGLNADHGYFDEEGIVVYHVNASLYKEEYEGETYYDVYNTNTDASDQYGTEDNLIEYVTHGSEYVYVEGDSLGSVTDDQGNRLAYTFTVDSLDGDTATITFTKR